MKTFEIIGSSFKKTFLGQLPVASFFIFDGDKKNRIYLFTGIKKNSKYLCIDLVTGENSGFMGTKSVFQVYGKVEFDLGVKS